MQKTNTESDTGTITPAISSSDGVLEDSFEVVPSGEDYFLVVNQRSVAWLVNRKTVRHRRFADASGHLVLEWVEWELGLLRWTYRAAFLALQGLPTSQLLGQQICLLSGQHLPRWSIVPGIDSPRIAFVLQNPQRLTTEQIFLLIYKGDHEQGQDNDVAT